MPITVPTFTTSAIITGSTIIADADGQLNIMMADIKAYVQNVYGSVSTSLEATIATTYNQMVSLYDSFDDRYLGTKTTDPVYDNDGGALKIGTLYFNSTTGALKVYTSTGWITTVTLDVYTKHEIQTELPAVGFTTISNVTPSLGQLTWNKDEDTLNLGMSNGVTQQIGQEFFIPVINQTGSTIPNGVPVMAVGSTGNSGKILITPHDGTQASTKALIGLTTTSILNGGTGQVTVSGKVRNINTTGSTFGETWVDGDVLYVKPNSMGVLTKVVPLDSQLKIPLAYVLHAHTNGTLLVRTTPIDENHDRAWTLDLVSSTNKIFIQPTEPIIPANTSAIWLQQLSDGNYSFWVKEN